MSVSDLFMKILIDNDWSRILPFYKIDSSRKFFFVKIILRRMIFNRKSCQSLFLNFPLKKPKIVQEVWQNRQAVFQISIQIHRIRKILGLQDPDSNPSLFVRLLPSTSKKLRKLVGILKATEEKSKIRVRFQRKI